MQVDSTVLSDADAEGETDDEIFTTSEHKGPWTSDHDIPILPIQSFASDLGSFPVCDWSRASLYEVLSSIPYKPPNPEAVGKLDSTVTGPKRKRGGRDERGMKKKRKFDTGAAASSSKYVLSSPTTRNEGQDEELELLRLDFAFKLNEEEIVDENLRYLATDARLKQTYHRSKEKETPRHTQPYVGPRVQNLSASCEPYNDRVCPFDEGEIHTGPRLSTWFEHFFGFHASQDGIHTTRPRAPLPIVSDRVVHLGTLS